MGTLRSPVPGAARKIEMGDDIRPPVLWRRPNARTYSYNQEFGGSYYRPMIDYIDTKNRQGVFFEAPTERIHLPDCAETYMKRGEPRPETVSGVDSVDPSPARTLRQSANSLRRS